MKRTRKPGRFSQNERNASMIIMIVTVCLTIMAELGGIVFINRQEPTLSLRLKKYGTVLVAGNLVLAVVSQYKQEQSGIAGWWYFGLFTYLLCLTIYDLKFKELPDWWHLLLPMFYAAAWLSGKQPVGLLNSGIIVLIYALVFGLIMLIRKDALGVGDMKLLLLCGVYAGSASVGIMIRGMILAFFLSIALLLFKKVTPKSGLPFVPFLLLGALWI